MFRSLEAASDQRPLRRPSGAGPLTAVPTVPEEPLMAGEPFTFWDYLKAAFWYKPRVGFLGPLPLNQLALFLPWWPRSPCATPRRCSWAAPLEVGYLAFLSAATRRSRS